MCHYSGVINYDSGVINSGVINSGTIKRLEGLDLATTRSSVHDEESETVTKNSFDVPGISCSSVLIVILCSMHFCKTFILLHLHAQLDP